MTTTMDGQSILLTVDGSVATLTLNRPEKYNAFDREMALLMQDKLTEVKQNPVVRVLVIRGSGKAFSAGQDIGELLDPNGPKMNRILSEHFNPICDLITKMNIPVIAAVNGVAAGAGCSLAICCDFVIAVENASFIQSFVNIGLIPDTGATYILPYLIGWQRAKTQMMLGEPVSAQAAENMGLIYKAVAAQEFDAALEQLTQKLAQSATQALAHIKMALRWTCNHTLREQLENEDKLQQRAAATLDFKEGLQAFVEKRKPIFIGH